MELSTDQQTALDKVTAWFNNDAVKRREPFILTGGAGTGKSTIVSAILDALPLKKTDILMLAPTGTAVKNVQLKTPGYPAQTISSFIEKPFTVIEVIDNKTNERVDVLRNKRDVSRFDIDLGQEQAFNPDDYAYMTALSQTLARNNMRAEANVGFKYRDDIDTAFKLLIIDEWGMVSEDKSQVLRRLGVPFLALGDPYQLKPVGAVQNSLIVDRSRTDFYHELTTTHRQAGDNPILQIATSARNNKNWRKTASHVKGEHVGILSSIASSNAKLANLIARSDVVLSASNASVRAYNKLGHDKVYDNKTLLGAGEKILFTMNTTTKDSSGAPLFTNGTLGTIGEVKEIYDNYGLAKVTVIVDDVTTEVIVNTLNLTDSRVSRSNLNNSRGGRIQRTLAKRAFVDIASFGTDVDEIVFIAYGYAMTVHKSQGKEWPNVVFDTDVPAQMRSNEASLIYTGITRAKENIIFI
jgi:ATP-dependent exoDNAse (exonuclease V), alpha subunit - helicase superfamily I member